MLFLKRTHTLYGIFLVVLSSVLSLAISSITHTLLSIPPTTLLFFKTSTAAACVYMCEPKALKACIKSQCLWLHILRSSMGWIGCLAIIKALQHLPIASTVMLSLSSILFTSLGYQIFTKKTVQKTVITMTCLALLSCMLILQPSMPSLYGLLPLASALFFSISNLLVKKISIYDSSSTSLLFLLIFMSLLSSPFAQSASSTDIMCCSLLGILFAAANLCLIEAYSCASAALIAPFKLIRLPISIAIGYYVFAETPDNYTLLGGTILCSTLIWFTYRRNSIQ